MVAGHGQQEVRWSVENEKIQAELVKEKESARVARCNADTQHAGTASELAKLKVEMEVLRQQAEQWSVDNGKIEEELAQEKEAAHVARCHADIQHAATASEHLL